MKLNKYIKNNLSVGSATLSQKFFSILSIFLIINISGLSVYGNYVIISSLVSLLLGLSSLGIGYNYMQKFSSSSGDKKEKLFFSQFFTNLIFVTIIIIIFLLLNKIFDFSLNGNENFFVAYFFFLVLSTQLTNFFRYNENFKTYSILVLLPNLFNCLFLSYFYFRNEALNLYDLITIISLSLIIQIFIATFLILKLIRFRFLFLTYNQLLNDIKNGLPFTLNFLLTTIINSSDRYVIMIFLGAKYVGIYSILFTISSLILMIPSVMTTILQPTLSRYKIENNISHLKKYVYTSESVFFAIWTPFLIGGIFYFDRILSLFTTEYFPLNNIYIFIILVLSSLFNGLIIIRGNIYFAFTKTKKMLSPIFLSSLLNIVLNILLIYLYKSIFFAALSSLVSYFIAFSIFQYQTNKLFFLKFKILNIKKIVFSSLIMITFSIFLDSIILDETNVMFILKILFSSVVYILNMYILNGMKEWNF